MNLDIFARLNKDTNKARLLAASFFMNMGVDTAYFVGFVGYVAYGFNANVTIIATTMAILAICSMVGNFMGGIIVDKLGPRRTAFYSNMTMALICVAMSFMTFRLTAFMVMTGVFGVVSSVQQSAFHTFAPYLSREREGIRRINSFMTTSMFIATMLGGILGALITTAFKPQYLFSMVAAVVIVSGVMVLFVREKYSPHSPTAAADSPVAKAAKENAHPLHTALEGWHLIRKTATLRFYLLVAIAMWFCFGAFDALESVYYRDVLLMPISWMGWINALISGGLAIGAFALSKIPGKYVSTFLLVILLGVEGVTTVLYVATTSPFWSAVGAFLLGIAFGVFSPLLNTLIQVDTPLKAAGRVMGTIDTIRRGFTFIPLAIAPTLSRLWGVQPVLVGASLMTILLAVALYPVSRRLDIARAGTVAQ